MRRRRRFGPLLAGLVMLAGCAREPTVGGDLALLFIPTPFILIGCLIGGCFRDPPPKADTGEGAPR